MVFTLLQRPLATHQLETCLLSKDYKNITSSLINQENDFFESVFEKFPCHFHPTSKPSKALCEGIFSAAQLYDVVKKTQLAVDSNIQSYRYLQGARKQREFKEEIITKAELDSAFKSNHSVQFFQPQRFSDHLHAIIAGFEDEFGSLAGASAYLTPPCSQGLAPHHDDVCVFILQTEGSKLWHLWAGEIELPEHHSDDISRTSLSNTPPVEVLLQQGDVLYLPRGTIHEAISQDTFSTHVTISVYQKYNFKTLVGAVFEEALEKSAASNVELRKGLPLRISESFGTFAGLLLQDASTAGSVQASAGLGSIRAQMYAKVKGFLTEVVQQISENIVDTAVDQLVSDFALHRLPPPAQEVNEKRADTVTKKGKRKRGDEEEKSAHRNAPQLLSKFDCAIHAAASLPCRRLKVSVCWVCATIRTTGDFGIWVTLLMTIMVKTAVRIVRVLLLVLIAEKFAIYCRRRRRDCVLKFPSHQTSPTRSDAL